MAGPDLLRQLARGFVEAPLDTLADPDALARVSHMVHQARAQMGRTATVTTTAG